MQDVFRVGGEFFQFVVAGFRGDDFYHFYFVELVLADHAAHVAPVRARFGAEAGGVRGVVERQVGFFEDGVGDEVGQADFRGRDEVEVALAQRSFEQIFFKFGQLSGAEQRLRVGKVRHVHFGVAFVAGVGVEHELGDGAVQAGEVAAQHGKARAGEFRARIEIQPDVFEVGVFLRREVKDARRAPAAHFEVVVFVFADGDAFVRRVGHGGQQRVQGVLDFGVLLFAVFLFAVQRSDLRHQRVGILAVFLRLADLRGEAVARRL